MNGSNGSGAAGTNLGESGPTGIDGRDGARVRDRDHIWSESDDRPVRGMHLTVAFMSSSGLHPPHTLEVGELREEGTRYMLETPVQATQMTDEIKHHRNSYDANYTRIVHDRSIYIHILELEVSRRR